MTVAEFVAQPVGRLCVQPTGHTRVEPSPAALLAGSFNPVHAGHFALAAAASRALGCPVAFELSLANVDKPDLDAAEVTRRLAQFVGVAPVWLTARPTFTQKAALFPGTAFVLGHDTALRLIDPKYYGGSAGDRDQALADLLAAGTRFVVGGRLDLFGRFCVWDGAGCPPGLAGLFVALTEADFRADVSSTALRAAGGTRVADESESDAWD